MTLVTSAAMYFSRVQGQLHIRHIRLCALVLRTADLTFAETTRRFVEYTAMTSFLCLLNLDVSIVQTGAALVSFSSSLN